MNKNLLVAIGIVGAIAVVVLIVATGGGGSEGAADPADDVQIGEGAGPPTEGALADVVDASVTRQSSDFVFEAQMATELPKKVRNGSLEFRWDVSEAGDDTWIVSANLNLGPTAAVTSQKTNYGASTIDGSLPGTIEVDGDTLRVTIKAAEIEGFPKEFTWRLRTTLDADRSDPSSAVATDHAPDSGEGSIEG